MSAGAPPPVKSGEITTPWRARTKYGPSGVFSSAPMIRRSSNSSACSVLAAVTAMSRSAAAAASQSNSWSGPSPALHSMAPREDSRSVLPAESRTVSAVQPRTVL
ncbi:Uncharacterised protein [Mycobacteroides abscessus subsp. abscessus]|nr:Uncharacterised protein [Mycobacteroides abscessus subsp. abscessus]